jgi:DNA-directed RNA polymerase specialized sigma24 family protein
MVPLNIIKKVAGHFKRYNPEIDYDDLFQEAACAFLQSQKTFDSSKNDDPLGWAYIQMKYAILNYRNKENKHKVVENLSEEPTTPLDPLSLLIQKEEIKELSKEAQQVVKTVLFNPSEFTKIVPTEAKNKIKRELKKQGFRHVQWAHVWKELKTVFS